MLCPFGRAGPFCIAGSPILGARFWSSVEQHIGNFVDAGKAATSASMAVSVFPQACNSVQSASPGRTLGVVRVFERRFRCSRTYAGPDRLRHLHSCLESCQFAARKNYNARWRCNSSLLFGRPRRPWRPPSLSSETHRGDLIDYVPSDGCMALVSRDVVLSVLGQKWQGAIAPLQLLAFYVCVRSIMPLIAQVLMVTGDSGFVMWNGIISAVALPIAFLIGSHWGPQGIAAAWVVAYPINAVPLYLRASRRISLSIAEFWHVLLPATQGTLLMALVVLVVQVLLSGHFTMVTRLAIQVLTGAIAYIAVVLLFHHDRLSMFRRGIGLLAGKADPKPSTCVDPKG